MVTAKVTSDLDALEFDRTQVQRFDPEENTWLVQK